MTASNYNLKDPGIGTGYLKKEVPTTATFSEMSREHRMILTPNKETR